MIIDPTLLLKIMPTIAEVAEKVTGKKTGLPEILSLLPDIKSPSVGDAIDLNDPDLLSFNTKFDLGIDHEKLGINFDKKPFTDPFKNSDDIFTWKTDTPKFGLKIEEYDDYFAKSKFDPWK